MENQRNYISKQEFDSVINSRNGCGIDDTSGRFHEIPRKKVSKSEVYRSIQREFSK